jgi:Uma2 family endonuclease
MKAIELDKPLSEEEYFLFEEKSELKHELLNNTLYEMSGISKYHNRITLNILIFLKALLKENSYDLYFEGFKVKTPNGNFFYPDVLICHTDANKYYTEKPILIVEVLSDTTRRYDLTDKFIQYQKIETLEYYLCVEPEQQVVVFYCKQEEGEWIAETFTKDDQIISFPKLAISFPLKNIYNF